MKYRRVKSHRTTRQLRRAVLVLLVFFGVMLLVQLGRSRRSDDAEQVSVADASEFQSDETLPVAVVPEPGTWVMFASGLAAVSWQARRKLFQKRKMTPRRDSASSSIPS